MSGTRKATMNRNDAWTLINEWTQAPHLIRHMLAVEAAMRAYTRRFGADEALWGLVGLVHDFDYELDPVVTVKGYPTYLIIPPMEKFVTLPLIKAILAH